MNLAESPTLPRDPQVSEWVQGLLQLPDDRLLQYFSQWPGWELPPLSDLATLKPVLDRIEQLLRTQIGSNRLSDVNILLSTLKRLQQAANSRNLHSMAEVFGLLLDLDDWEIILKTLGLLQAGMIRSSRLFRPHRSQELTELAYKLYTLAMGVNVNNNHTFTFQEMHASDSMVDHASFTYRRGDETVQLSTEDEVQDLNPELAYALRCRRRLARAKSQKEVMLAQLMSVSALLKTLDAQYIQELWKSYPELWLLPSLVDMLRDDRLPPLFHKQIIEVMRAILHAVEMVPDASSREREVARSLHGSLSPAQTHGLLQTMLRDVITGTPGLLPPRTCADQSFLKSLLSLVETLALFQHRGDNAHIPGLVSLLLQMLVRPSAGFPLKFKPHRIAKASQVLAMLIQHSIVMFKELDGLQVTLDLLILQMQRLVEARGAGDRTQTELINALFQLIETALKCWDQQPGMINNQISKIVTSPLLGLMQTIFEVKKFDIFEPCVSLLSLMTDEQPALTGDLAQKGLLSLLLTAMETYETPNPGLVQTFSRFLWKISVHQDGVRLLESANVVDCILCTLRGMEMTGNRGDSALEIASNLKEISSRVPSIRMKIMDYCGRILANLKESAKQISREDYFSQLSSISFLLSNLLHLSEDMIEMFIQNEGLDLFFSLFKLPILPVSLDSEMHYAVTCFQNLTGSQFTIIFRKVVDSISEILTRLEQLLGPLRNVESLSKVHPLDELSPMSPDDQVTVTLTSLTSFLEMAVWLLRFTGGSSNSIGDMVNVIASLGQLFRIVVYEETLMDQAKSKRLQDWAAEVYPPDHLRAKLISVTVISLQNLLRFGTSIGAGRSRQSDESMLSLLVCASETLCSIASSIQLTELTSEKIAFAGKLLTNLMKILFHKYSSALSLVAFYNGEGTKSIVGFVNQLKTVTYAARRNPENEYAEALETLWTAAGQFLESLATWEYAARSSMSSILKNFGIEDIKEVTRTFQTSVLDAMEELDYKDCSELSTGFMKNVLEVVRVMVEELKDNAPVESSALTPLMEMGFSEMRVRQALLQVGGNSIEAAMDWLLNHSDMPEDFTFQEHDWQDTLANRLKNLGDVLVKILSVNPDLSAPVSNLVLILAKKNGEMVKGVTTQLVQLCSQQLSSLSSDILSFSITPCTHISVLSILQQLALLSQQSVEVLDILIQSDFQRQLAAALRLIANDLRVSEAHPLVLEPILTLLNSILKYSGKQDPDLIRIVAELLKTNTLAEPPIINSEAAVVSLLTLLTTATSSPEHAEAFLSSDGLYHLFCMRSVQMDVQAKTVLPLLATLSLQLVEDPYLLEVGFSVEILTAVGSGTPLENVLKNMKKLIKRSKVTFLKALQNVCTVVLTQTQVLKLEPKTTDLEVDSAHWNGVQQLLRSLQDLYENEQTGKSGFVFNSDIVIGLLGDALQQYPCLVEQVIEDKLSIFDTVQGAKVTRPLIAHLVRNLIPYRYALRYQEGKIFYTYPSSNTVVPPQVFDLWVKAVAKLLRALSYRQTPKTKPNTPAAALYTNLLLRQNKPVLRARKHLAKEMKEVLTDVSREDWFGVEPSMSAVKACTLVIMQLLKEGPRSVFVVSSPAEFARLLVSDQCGFVSLLCEVAKGVKLTAKKSTVMLSTILTPLELLTRYGITFALRSAKQPLDTEAMIEEPVENQEPMQLQEEPNSADMILDSEDEQGESPEREERPQLIEGEEEDSGSFELGEGDNMANLMMIENRHGEQDWEEADEPPRFFTGMQRMDVPDPEARMAPPHFLYRGYEPGRLYYDRMAFSRQMMEEREEELLQYLTGLRYEHNRLPYRYMPGMGGRLDEGDSYEELLQVMRQRRRRERNLGTPPQPVSNVDELIIELTFSCAALAVPEAPVESAPQKVEEVSPPQAPEQPVQSPAAHPDVDPAFLEALPENIRREVLETMQASAPGQVSEDVLSELPVEIQEELRQEQRRQQRMAETMDNATMVAMLAPDLRRDVLLTASEEFLSSLPEEMVQEAQLLRERLHRVIGNDRQPAAAKPHEERKDIQEIVADERLCEMLLQPGDSFLDMLFRALYLVNPVNKEVLGSLFLNLSAHPVSMAKILEGMLALLKALAPRGEFPPQHLLGSESFVENYQQVYAVVAGRILDILLLLTKKNPRASAHFVSSPAHFRTSLTASVVQDEEVGFRSLIALMSSRLYQSSASHLIPLLSVISEVIEREGEHPPVLDQVALAQICSMLSFESLGENGVTIVVDIIHKLSKNLTNRELVEPAVTSEISTLKSDIISILGSSLNSANIQKQVQLLRLCKVLKIVNPEAKLEELNELWGHLSATFRTVAETEGEGAGMNPILTRLLPLVETFFVAHSDSSSDEVATFFSDKNRKILNILVKQNPALLESTLIHLIQRFHSLLDFENKREYFKDQTKRMHLHRAGDTIRLKIHRNNVFIDSFHKLKSRQPQEMYGRLQVDFIGEESLDLGGPTREWFSALAREMFNPNYALFKLAANGVSFQPNPRSYANADHLDFFKFVGKIIGKALIDGFNLEVHFTRSFYKHMLGQSVTVQDMEDLDPEIYKSLQQLLSIDVDSSDLFEDYFIYHEEHFGQLVTKELIPNGKNVRVTEANKAEYVQLLCHMKMTESISLQITAFLEGLHSLVPKDLIKIFDAKELELLIAGLHEINVEDLRENTEYQGYGPDSPLITWFWEILEDFSNEERAQLLQFVTGSSKVPLEGFKALRGSSGVQRFQIHKSFAATERLPTAHTWYLLHSFNQLDLPEYPTKEVLHTRLRTAISEGNNYFGIV